MTSFLHKANILVTGGTGSFGQRFVELTLKKYNPERIIIYSRDEMKQWDMEKRFGNDPRLRMFLGDVRDKDRLRRACENVDVVIHAAAIKIVPAAEYNPFEAIKTNVMGAMNVIDAAIDCNVKRVVALSTDKACNPINLYGATKLCSDKLFIAGNSYSGGRSTRMCVVRYGNVMGSRGSILPLFKQLSKSGEIPITDERMTRFMISLEQGIELVWEAVDDTIGGEIYVRKIPSMKVSDIARAIAPESKLKVIGIRPGEKLHEQMISVEDARTTFEYDWYYKIFPQLDFLKARWTRIEESHSPLRSGRPVPDGFCYSSETNTEWMSAEELREWIGENHVADDPIHRLSVATPA